MITTPQIEMAVALHFNPRLNVIVPNIYWGMGLHYEADLVVLRPSGFAIEIEIKTMASDIVADTKKHRHHDSNLFRELWFAVPDKLKDHPDIPMHAGILAVSWVKMYGKNDDHHINCSVKTIRRGKLNRGAIKWNDKKRQKLLELGVMRIWSLKEALVNEKSRKVTQK